MRALEDAHIKEWEAIKYEVKDLKGKEREEEGYDDDDSRSVILLYRTSRRVLRGGGRSAAGEESHPQQQPDRQEEHEPLPEDEDDDQGGREGTMERRKRRLFTNCARLRLGMMYLSDEEDADLSLPTTDITSAPAEGSLYPCCSTRPSSTSHCST